MDWVVYRPDLHGNKYYDYQGEATHPNRTLKSLEVLCTVANQHWNKEIVLNITEPSKVQEIKERFNNTIDKVLALQPRRIIDKLQTFYNDDRPGKYVSYLLISATDSVRFLSKNDLHFAVFFEVLGQVYDLKDFKSFLYKTYKVERLELTIDELKALITDKKIEEAKLEIGRSHSLQPQKPFYLELGKHCENQGLVDLAYEFYCEIHPTHPSYEEAQNSKKSILQQRLREGQVDQVMDEAKKDLEKDPNSSLIYDLALFCEESLQRTDLAYSFYDELPESHLLITKATERKLGILNDYNNAEKGGAVQLDPEDQRANQIEKMTLLVSMGEPEQRHLDLWVNELCGFPFGKDPIISDVKIDAKTILSLCAHIKELNEKIQHIEKKQKVE